MFHDNAAAANNDILRHLKIDRRGCQGDGLDGIVRADAFGVIENGLGGIRPLFRRYGPKYGLRRFRDLGVIAPVL
jgi:hypothetical protein